MKMKRSLPSTRDPYSLGEEFQAQAIALSELPAALRYLCEHGHEFELDALCHELQRQGVGPTQIHFSSRRTLGPTHRPVHALRFYPGHSVWVRGCGVSEFLATLPRVEVELGFGLFSGTSPLPDYLRRIANDFPSGDGLHRLLRMLDDALAHQASVRSLACDVDSPSGYPGSPWSRSLRDLSPPQALWSMDWLFRKAFPELAVCIRRGDVTQLRPAEKCELGLGSVGFAGLGGFHLHQQTGFLIELISYDAEMSCGWSWVDAAPTRLRQWVFPRLAGQHLRLDIRLTIRGRTERLALSPGVSLGYGSLGAAAAEDLCIPIFCGDVDDVAHGSAANDRPASASSAVYEHIHERAA